MKKRKKTIRKIKAMKIDVVVNVKSGVDSKSPEEYRSNLEQEFNKYLKENDKIDFHIIKPENFIDQIKNICKNSRETVVAAGGDGTVSAVASMIAGTPVTLAVIPAGTFNNFARDCGIPLEMSDAVRNIFYGNKDTIDTGKLNGRVFINNSSIGIYPHVVRYRKQLVHQLGYSKFPAMFAAMLKIFRRFPLYKVSMKAGNEKKRFKAPFVFVGNNTYDTELYRLGRRKNLKDGKLGVYYTKCTNRLCIFANAVKFLFNKLNTLEDFEKLEVKELTLYPNKKKVSVSMDGEVVKMKSPLHYKIMTRSLNVVVPKNNMKMEE